MINSLFRVSVVLGLVGMGLGIVMGIRQDFTLAPAHAHLNLLGFVVLFLSALYYRVVPEAAASVIARLQAAIAVIGAVVFPIGIGTVLLYGPARFEPIVVGGAIIVFIGMLLFAFVVFTTSSVKAAAATRALPGTNRTASGAVAGAE
jgi:hypothetical protein